MSLTRLLGLAAVGGLLMLAAPAGSALAMSLSNPGAAAAVRDGSKPMTTEVRWGHHWHHRWHHHRHWRHWRHW